MADMMLKLKIDPYILRFGLVAKDCSLNGKGSQLGSPFLYIADLNLNCYFIIVHGIFF